MLINRIKQFIHKKPENAQKQLLFKLKPKVVLEFMGPSGVGKSTLFRGTFSNPYFDFFNQNNISELKTGFPAYEIQNDVYNNLLLNKNQNIFKSKYNAFVNAELMNYYSRIISDDIIIQYSKAHCGFVLEEGLSHNFSTELLELSDNLFASVLENRILIYLRPDKPELVVERIRKRQSESGHMVIHHSGKTDRELLDIAHTSITDFDNLLIRAKDLRIHYIKINAEDTSGATQIHNFLKENEQLFLSKV